MAPLLDERARRLWAAAESVAIGYGGDALVSSATGLARETIRNERRELAQGVDATGRIRRPGAGRPDIEQTQPGVTEALDLLVEPLTRGDPMSPLRWTCKSRAKLAAALTAQGWRVSSTTVGHLLHALGYRLQALRKTQEGTSHPDRNAQFEHINTTAAAFLQRQQPVISVDTKKKELVGNFKNAGQEWQPAGTPEPVRVHDFPGDAHRQSDSLRRLRHGAQRSLGERGPRPRHARVRRRLDPPVVDDDGPRGVSASGRVVHHGRCGRQQRLSLARVEAGAATVGRRPAPPDSRLAFPAGHQQVEQDRASPLLSHHRELARSCAPHVPDGGRAHWPYANGDRLARQSEAGRAKVSHSLRGQP